MIEVQGEFERGAAVACLSLDGAEIARSLSNYSSSDARRIARHASHDIEEILGYLDESEMLHRDNLVLRYPPRPRLDAAIGTYCLL